MIRNNRSILMILVSLSLYRAMNKQ